MKFGGVKYGERKWSWCDKVRPAKGDGGVIRVRESGGVRMIARLEKRRAHLFGRKIGMI